MNKVVSTLTLIFLLAFTSSLHAQSKRKDRTVKPPPVVQTVDLNKVNPKVTQPNLSDLQNLKIKHFTQVSSGNPSDRYGAIELLVVDRLFPVLNTTNITLKEKKTAPKL